MGCSFWQLFRRCRERQPSQVSWLKGQGQQEVTLPLCEDLKNSRDWVAVGSKVAENLVRKYSNISRHVLCILGHPKWLTCMENSIARREGGGSFPSHFLLPNTRHCAAQMSRLLPIFVPVEINSGSWTLSSWLCNRRENFLHHALNGKQWSV